MLIEPITSTPVQYLWPTSQIEFSMTQQKSAGLFSLQAISNFFPLSLSLWHLWAFWLQLKMKMP